MQHPHNDRPTPRHTPRRGLSPLPLPPLHIAFVTETYPPEINGVALTAARSVAFLRQRGHVVDVIRPRPQSSDGADVSADILVHGIGLPLYPGVQFGLPAGRMLQQRWARKPPDLVHIVTEGPLGWSALHAATSAGIPVTSDYRTDFSRYSAHYGIGALRRPIARYLRHFHNRAHRTFVPTRALRDELAQDGYRGLTVIGRGIDRSAFHPGRRCARLRSTWGASDDTPVILYVGRLAAEKNIALAQRAQAAIEATGPRSIMLWVGDGPRAAWLQQRDSSHQFLGWRSGTELAEIYASADVFLFPSLTETFGNVTLEALASGLAVVAFDRGAAREHAEHERSALLARPGDETGFIELAQRACTNRLLRQRLRKGALGAVGHLSWEQVLAEFEAQLVAQVRHRAAYAR